MENEKLLPTPDQATKPGGRSLPKETSFVLNPGANTEPVAPPAAGPSAFAATTPEPGERDGVFRHLVKEDADIAGLVAYSIYKQNKLDWLTAFEQAKGRAPNADELTAYIIGEGTPRRLVTYRQLAEAMLGTSGPEAGGRSGKSGATARGAGERGAMTTSLVATYALIVVLFFIGFLLAAHYTMTSR